MDTTPSTPSAKPIPARPVPARSLTVLRVLLVLAIAESAVHYTDNTLRFSDYRGDAPPAVSAWIARWMIPVSWVLFTAAAVLAYRAFRGGRRGRAAALLAVYSLSGLISIGHYFGVSISDLSVFQNTFVFADVGLGAAILGFAIWTASGEREPRETRAAAVGAGDRAA